jgi:hypothetical protein
MATRSVFNWYTSPTEQATYRKLYGEFVQIWGIDVTYIPRSSDSAGGFDLLFGDDPSKKYLNNYTIEMYIQTTDGFQGAEFFGKFGDVVKKSAEFMLPLTAFQREVGSAFTRPREGDLLWLPNFRALFEIKFVDEEQQFYPLGINGGDSGFVGFSLKTEKFRYNNEKITTTVDEITAAVNKITTVYEYVLDTRALSGTFLLGESVYQGANANSQKANATVVAWNLPTGVLQMKDMYGLFVPGQLMTGVTSNAHATLTSFNVLNDVNNGLQDNQGINTEGDTILNFNETNPFGQPD